MSDNFNSNMSSTRLVCVTDFEEKAKGILEKKTLGYYNSGAGEQFTLQSNRDAFRRLRIRPRYMRNVSQVDTACRILGCNLKWPVGISPSALQKLAHPDGEGGNARAAGKMGSVFVLSNTATSSIEEVAEVAPHTDKWFQVYLYKDRSVTEQFVRRAERSNFKAIVLTVDCSIFGQRWDDARNSLVLPSHLRLANFQNQSDNEGGSAAVTKYIGDNIDAGVTWKDVKWLVQTTHLPVIAKGVLTAEGAILAREAGCAGVLVSNHGARHLDSLPAPIEVLPEIVKAVGDDMVIMLDSGIRSGNDVFKALALGAKMVFIGRPAIWGLACGGQAGVEQMLTVLKEDLIKVMTLAGCPNLESITSNMVVHESRYSKI